MNECVDDQTSMRGGRQRNGRPHGRPVAHATRGGTPKNSISGVTGRRDPQPSGVPHRSSDSSTVAGGTEVGLVREHDPTVGVINGVAIT